MFYIILVSLVVTIITLFYVKLRQNAGYWAKRNVPFDKTENVVGTFWNFFAGDRAMFEVMTDLYRKFPDAPAVGTMSLSTPVLLVKHPDNLQQVLSGDFHTFNHRGVDVNGDVDKLADNVLLMNGIRWKLTRQKMTPLFTAAKLRNMYYIMDRSANDFIAYLDTNASKQNAFDTLSSFCSASIAAAVFGIDTKSTMESPLLDMARKASESTPIQNLKFVMATVWPGLFKLLKLRAFGNHEKFFIGTIKKVLRAREQQTTRTHDFADLCVALQRQGTLRDPATGYEIEPTDELLAAQAFFFFIAGVEPSATTMFFALFELAKHPEVLSRIHKDVDELFESCDGKPTYEALNAMEYLDMVIDESARINPAIGVLNRKCTKEGVLPAGNIRLEKGTLIMIPIYAIHHDPDHYPDPEVFDPERFSAEAKANRPNSLYLPFGDGHRMCLGMRFARMQVKIGLVHILRHYTVQTRDANKPIKFSKLPVQLRPTNIDMQFIPRSQK